MKKIYQLLVFIGLSQLAFAQYNVQDVYVATGGSFSNPDDYVEIKKINPETYAVDLFDVIYTQAVTDLLVYGDKMFVAAMDSLVAYDLTTGARYAAISVANTNKLSVVNDDLWLSRQEGAAGPPADGVYLKVFNIADLSLKKDVEGINADAAYVNFSGDSLYVTVPGNWAATTGSIAVLDMATYTVQRVMDLGSDAVGIFNIYRKGEMLGIVCKTPYMGTMGTFVSLNPSDGSYEINSQEAVFGFGAGIDVENNRSFLLYNNTIAAHNCIDQTFTEIAPDPGSASWITYASAAYERGSETIWANFSDYYSFGTCKVYNLAGEEQGTAEVGISPEAMGFHYENATGVIESNEIFELAVYPNPASSNAVITTNAAAQISVYNTNGALVEQFNSNGIASINVSDLTTGIYLIKAETATQATVTKLMVR